MTIFHYECQMVSNRRRSRLSGGIQQELVLYFVAGASVRSAAELCGVNRNTAILYFHKLRESIAENLAAGAPDLMAGETNLVEKQGKYILVLEFPTIIIDQFLW